MNHKGTKNIVTERLILRQFELSDIAPVFINWTSNNQVTKYLRWPTHEDISVTERVLKEWIEKYKDPSFYQWAIVLKDINEPI